VSEPLAGRLSHHHPCFARVWTRLAGRVGAAEVRNELLHGLAGRVLEVGAGDGRSFANYPAEAVEIVAVEPEPYLRRRALAAAQAASRPVSVLAGTAERLPVADHSFDAAVVSLVLCSVSDQATALAELRRAVRPGGELRFLEHVAADPGIINTAQRALDGSHIWPTLGGGCHLSRDTLAAIRGAGFQIERVRRVDLGAVSRAVPFLLGCARSPSPA
jgi:ubiquinone/menaquinone biosynthesis C-methylase UbiE